MKIYGLDGWFEFWNFSIITFRWFKGTSGAETTDICNRSFSRASAVLIPVILCPGCFVLVPVIPPEVSKYWHVTCAVGTVYGVHIYSMYLIFIFVFTFLILLSRMLQTQNRGTGNILLITGSSSHGPLVLVFLCCSTCNWILVAHCILAVGVRGEPAVPSNPSRVSLSTHLTTSL